MATADELPSFERGPGKFERQLPENCVEYMLFLVDGEVPVGPGNLLAGLEAVRKAASELSDSLTKDYIWQKEAFSLEVVTRDGLTYLFGSTNYGDNVEDEWLIVYLLRRLGEAFPHVWIRVADEDGEFLLVEAANVLPKWLNPEIDSHRVWIHSGKLRIIPLDAQKSQGGQHDQKDKALSLADAIAFIKQRPDALIHSPFIEAEAFYRLEKYPDQIKTSVHYSMVTIPRKLAYLIHARPKSIAPATEAFYLRDPNIMHKLEDLQISPKFPPLDLITVGVRFTRVLYAQLKSQQFDPPPAWAGLVQPLTDASKGKESGNAQKDLSRMDLGMKVTYGFELMVAKAEESNSRVVREVAILLDDLEEDGDSVLPTDDEIKTWDGVDREDDDSWMDINYEDFERELEGKPGRLGETGFGNVSTQADLQRMVSRFEAFLNDDAAGLDGAEVDEMDEDDDEDDEDSGEDSEDEDKEVSFDEVQFARMMKEMMGLPPDDLGEAAEAGKRVTTKAAAHNPPDADEDEEIKRLAEQMELELKGHGALTLDPDGKQHPGGTRALEGNERGSNRAAGKGKEKAENGSDSDDDEGIDVDYHLAKNLMESFKGQAGMAGPAGNMLAMLGIHLPPDDGADES